MGDVIGLALRDRVSIFLLLRLRSSDHTRG